MDNREHSELVDLGAASVETQGGGEKFVDIEARQLPLGIADE
ncbi:benenodin family lasso peptide [Sphingomonas soli]|nr:benenodin family lasso peptide [Sphingomonas soli]